jgi:hypothetical protein
MLNRRLRHAAAVIALPLALIGCGGDTSTSAGASPASTPTPFGNGPSPSESADVPASTQTAALTWSVEPFPGRIHALAFHQGQLVAVGRDDEGLASWTSRDGVQWDRHAVPNPTFIQDMVDDFGPALYDGTSMGSITRLDETLFSFGTFFGPIDFYRPVGWRSTDGAAWEFIESANEFYAYGAATAAASVGDGLAAAHGTGLTAASYSLWTWTLDTGWRQSDVRSTLDLVITHMDLTAVQSSIIAVGQRAEGTGAPPEHRQGDPVAWRSADPEDWQQFDLPAEVALACSVAAGPTGGFTVLGRTDTGHLAAWSIKDGSTWAEAAIAPLADPLDCGAVDRAGDWLVATAISQGRSGTTIWLSRDGLTWTIQSTPVGVLVNGIAELDGDLFIFGTTDATDTFSGVLLRGEAAP